MIDVHSHILSGIDDGAKSIEISLEMLRIAAESGTTDIIATPHVNRGGVIPHWSDINTKTELLRQKAQEAAIPINIYSGAEVELNYDALQLFKEGSHDYCLAGSRYILVELTSQSQPEQVEGLLYEVMLRGFIPILAHAERYERIMAQPAKILKWMHHGTLLQCNAGSFMGCFGSHVKKMAELLLYNHMVTFIGSDGHNTTSRNTNLHKTEQTIIQLDHGRTDTVTACAHNAAKILQNSSIYPVLPEQWKEPHHNFLSMLVHTFSLR